MPREQPPTRWTDLGWRKKTLRLKDFDYSSPDHVYFITLCARHLTEPFANTPLADEVSESILHRSRIKQWHVYAYCLMPDHLHLALSPVPGGPAVPALLQSFKSYTTRQAWKHGCQGALWQRSYYDHAARREEDVAAICRYILENPVRTGLVEDEAAWSYSEMPDPIPG